MAQHSFGQSAQRSRRSFNIKQLCDIGCGYPETVCLTIFPQHLHGGFKIRPVMRVQFAREFLPDLAARLRLISGDGINQFIQDDRVVCDPVTDLTRGADQTD